MKTKTLTVALGLAVVTLTGCVGGADYTAQLTEPGVWWTLVALNGEPPAYTYGATFSSDGRFNSSMSCNECWGSYVVVGNILQFQEITTSVVACGSVARVWVGPGGATYVVELPDPMGEENVYLDTLRGVTRYAIDDEWLVIFDSEGEAILVYQRREGDPPPPLLPY